MNRLHNPYIIIGLKAYRYSQICAIVLDTNLWREGCFNKNILDIKVTFYYVILLDSYKNNLLVNHHNHTYYNLLSFLKYEI